MKTRMTFRLADELATELRKLPNQTEFVEAVLREALGATCPTCQGSGRVPASGPTLPNWRSANLPRLDRETALQLKALVRLARELAATNIALESISLEGDRAHALRFALKRDEDALLEGRLIEGRTEFTMH
jgi:hypothetical protein